LISLQRAGSLSIEEMVDYRTPDGSVVAA